MTDGARRRDDTRTAIVEAAAALLRDGGPGALTTRGVAEAAGVQAPTIYRLFGDKDGLLEAVAEHVMAGFVSGKARQLAEVTAADSDPVDDLRSSWLRQIDFGLDNPALFRFLSDPDRVAGSAAAQAGQRILETRIHRVATAGRLRVPEPRAVTLVQAAGTGLVHVLLALPPEQRDPALRVALLDAVLGQVLTTPSEQPPVPDDAPTSAAVTLRAHADSLEVLSGPERLLLGEWLDRVVAAHA